MGQLWSNPQLWYDKYLNDGAFRLQQEVEAYGTQFAFIRKHVKGRLRDWAKDNMAKALASESYGNLVSTREAEQLIRQFANNNNL